MRARARPKFFFSFPTSHTHDTTHTQSQLGWEPPHCHYFIHLSSIESYPLGSYTLSGL
jgi:hypothetical protein